MKRKPIKPFIRYIRLSYGEDVATGIMETFQELGYTLYNCPVEDGGMFISNVPLTEGWLFANAKKFGVKLRGWKPSPKNFDEDDTLDEIW